MTGFRNIALYAPFLSLGMALIAAGCGIGVTQNQAVGARVSGAVSTVTIDSTGGTHPDGWLYTHGNHIYTSDGHAWHGRGANIQDTRSCGACPQDSDPNEVIRRIDALVDTWGANFLRLTLESDDESAVLTDPNYLLGIEKIVAHVGTKPGVFVMVSVWSDPSLSSQGWPTAGTQEVWTRLAQTFNKMPFVLFGVANEPTQNYDGSLDADVWTAMNSTVEVIRAAETLAGSQQHIVAVQGTGGWARYLDYYEGHPIKAGGGTNVAYEVHVYDGSDTFEERFIAPSKVIPVIIGEFGPVEGTMTTQDCSTLLDEARSAEVPHLAWTFHMRCPPNLLEDTSGGGCGLGMTLTPTAWGRQIQGDLSQAW